MNRQRVVAMILAGGQGSRLGVLTELMAKPAVPFGSRYRIIDFPLSNCTNSGIEAVGVLTQYEPLQLNAYIGNGHSWDLDRNNGGAFILPPYQSSSRSDWYKGTANAIYQNMAFIERYRPDYVLILSGDHIYKMDYEKMVEYHKEKHADATIAVLEVPWEETFRFGIMNTNQEDEITEFVEKPKHAESNLASMGVYCFSWKTLRRFLIEDEMDDKSSKDFGKNIIPAMLDAGQRLIAYRFSGYWKDVGTIASLWEANMDLLDHPDQVNLHDPAWRIYSRNPSRPAHYIGEQAMLDRAALTDGDEVYGTVEHSVLSHSVVIEEDAIVTDSILMPGVHVGKGAKLNRCVVGINTKIGAKVQIGPDVEDGNTAYLDDKLCSDNISLLEDGIEIKPGLRFAAQSMITKPKTGSEDEFVLLRDKLTEVL